MNSQQLENQEAIENHLNFYKSLMRSDMDMNRINHYLELLQDHEDSNIKLDDPVDEGIRTVFRLVRDSGMDPWAIDIREFIKMYSKRVKSNKFNIIVAGKLLVLAWDVVRLQSEATMAESERASQPECTFGFDFEDELFFPPPEPLPLPDFDIEQSLGREPSRPATVYEILEVFDEIGEDMRRAEEQAIIDLQLREKRKAEKKFNHKMGSELDEKDIAKVWERIQNIGAGEFAITELYTNKAKDNITTFLSVLHLVFRGYLDVRQDDLLHGQIMVSMIVESDVAKIDAQSPELEVI